MGENFSYDVFLSHSSKENEEVRELAERLKRDGLRVWLDKWEIRPAENILAKIGQGLKQSRTLILFMSKAYFESKWAKFEAYTLIFRDPTNEQRRFIPLLIKNCIIPDILIQFAYIDWRKRKRSDEAYQKILAACGYDKKAVTRPPGKRELVIKKAKKLKGHKGNVLDVSVTPDGKKVVSGSTDKTLKVWDLGSGQCLRTFRGHDSSIFNVKVTPKGDFVVSGSDDGTLKLWNLKSGKCLVTFEEFSGLTYGIAITPDGKRMVSGSNDITLKLWDLQSGQCLASFGDDYQRDDKYVGVWAVAVTPDGSSVVAGLENKTLEVWDLETGQCLTTFEKHNGIVNGVAVTPDGSKVVSGSNDNTLKVWDIASGKCLATFEGHSARVTGLAVTPDGKRVVSGSDDNTVKVWDLESGQCLATLEGHTDKVFGVSVTPDGKRVVSGSKDSTVRVWELPEFDVSVEPSLSPRYTNAKVALVGESGVGKTGLGIRIAEKRWAKTDSTHGMNVWQLELPGMKDSGMDREVWLWDFAGQQDYRLIHQLYMDETALALMIIDPQRNNPFDNLGHWEKALETAVKHDPAKLLVAGRCDRGGMTVSSSKVVEYCKTHGYSGFVNTAARTGEGCKELKEMIAKSIPWDRLPWTSTTRLLLSKMPSFA
jgi:small GTP-binding protein